MEERRWFQVILFLLIFISDIYLSSFPIECQDNLCNVPLQPGFISPTQQQGPGTRESQETLLFSLQPKLILIFMKLIRDLCGRPQEIF